MKRASSLVTSSIFAAKVSNHSGIPSPEAAILTELTQRQIVYYLTHGENEYDGRLEACISSIFVIAMVSIATTFFPILAQRSSRSHILVHIYLPVRYFSAGVIVATAFIRLLDPTYDRTGPASYVDLVGGWSVYRWAPPSMLTSGVGIL